MLDEKDLHAIADLMHREISASEQRLSEQMDAKISASEQRLSEQMDAKISASERRVLDESAHNMRVILESYIDPKFQILAEGIDAINKKIDRMPTSEDMEIANSRISTLEAIVKRLSRDVNALKKAQ